MAEGHPNHKYPGCYALFDATDQLLYIGTASRRYTGDLARRLLAHVIRPIAKGGPYAFSEKWKPIARKIHTISFSKEFGYMASALEQFLIREHPTTFNKR